MKPYKKKKPILESGALPKNSKKKNVPRPWIPQRKWNSKEEYLKSFMGSMRPGLWEEDNLESAWIKEYYSKYISLDHALQQMGKSRREWRDRLIGSQWRLFNTETKEIVYLELRDKMVVLRGQTTEDK